MDHDDNDSDALTPVPPTDTGTGVGADRDATGRDDATEPAWQPWPTSPFGARAGEASPAPAAPSSAWETIPTPGAAPASGPGAPPSAPSAVWHQPGAGPARHGSSTSAGAGSARRSWWMLLVAAVIGALVGALVAGGLVAAADDDSGGGSVTQMTRGATTVNSSRPSTALTDPGDIGQILAKVQPAVVRIDSASSAGGQGTGTGFIFDSDGLIATNAHVVQGADSVQVTLETGDRVTGDVLGVDPRLDLAVVDIDGSDHPTVELGDSDAVQVGDAVVAIGNALGLSGGSGPTVTSGIVSALDRTISLENGEQLYNAVQTDAAINPGNSGGPLVDTEGRVIGINTAIASPQSSNNIGFAIAITPAKPAIESLQKGEQPAIPLLGVSTRELPIDQEGTLGAYVQDVTAGSGADKAGIEVGDVIIEIDGRRVTTPDDVGDIVRRKLPGESVTVVVERDGRRRTFTATLTEREAAS
jgi:S1-C subfamily serine protease